MSPSDCGIKARAKTRMCSCAITTRTASLSTAHTVSKKRKRGKMGVNMRVLLYALLGAGAIFCAGLSAAQDVATPAPATPKPASGDLPATSTVMRTNSMAVLDDKKKLGSNDYVSFRVVEDRDNDSQRLRVNGNGDFANKRKVKLTRKTGQEFTVDLKRVIEEGKTDEDVELQPDDQIYVPQRLINM